MHRSWEIFFVASAFFCRLAGANSAPSTFYKVIGPSAEARDVSGQLITLDDRKNLVVLGTETTGLQDETYGQRRLFKFGPDGRELETEALEIKAPDNVGAMLKDSADKIWISSTHSDNGHPYVRQHPVQLLNIPSNEKLTVSALPPIGWGGRFINSTSSSVIRRGGEPTLSESRETTPNFFVAGGLHCCPPWGYSLPYAEERPNNAAYVLKISKSGEKKAEAFVTAANSRSIFQTSTVMRRGDLIVAGTREMESARQTDLLISRFSPTLSEKWTYHYEHLREEFSGDFEVNVVSIVEPSDESGVLVLAKIALGQKDKYRKFSAHSYGAVLVKVSPAGQIIWRKTFFGKGSFSPETMALAADGRGAIIGGSTTFVDAEGLATGDRDVYLLSVDSTYGLKNWVRVYGGKLDDGIKSLVVGPDGSLSAVGFADAYDKYAGTHRYDRQTRLLIMRTNAQGEI